MTDSYIKQVANLAYGAGRTDAFTEMNSRGLSFTNIDKLIASVPKPEPVARVITVGPDISYQVGFFLTKENAEKYLLGQDGGVGGKYECVYTTKSLYAYPPDAQSEIDNLKKSAREQELMIDSLWDQAKLREAFIEDLLADKTECNWTQDGYGTSLWESECGTHFCLEDGSPLQNGMKFCIECGKKLVEHPYILG